MTPAITSLKAQRIPHVVRRYEIAQADDATYGEAVAQALGADPRSVFKTLIAQLNTGELVVGIVPVANTLDLHALAAAAGAKSAAMAQPQAAERATGYVTGGISPFGQRKRLRTFVDGSIRSHAAVFVSAGRRGLQLELSPEALIRASGAAVADLAR
jgi:Cys-tRNA(Pro)/Cys-tRNA(Cys) deacylase